ncbi:MAG: NapC/NirT family cytochrome c [Desulfobulbaceae bacterium]
MAQFSNIVLEKTISFFTRSKCSLLGGIIVLILFPVLLVSILLDMQGVVENPYFGFLIYMVMGPLFVIGLLLIIGGTLFCGEKGDLGIITVEYFKEQLSLPGRFSRVRRLIFLSSFITFVTLVIVGVVTYTGFHYTESVSFCGQFCHSVMEPEYVTYKNSPHSQVPCVQCHIGKEAEWLTKSKFSGARQLLAVLFDSYPRPIPTPIKALRPTRGTCENCHRPEVFHGDKLYVEDKFLADEQNTHVQTVMVMRIGSGGYSGRKAHGIHWHVSEDHTVSYVGSADHEYISEVTLVDAEGKRKVYRRETVSGGKEMVGERVMDCMDCHNRPTHVFKSADDALNEKLLTGIIPSDIPYIKRQGLAAVTKEYSSQDEARRSIAREIMDWYRKEYPEIVAQQEEKLAMAVRGIQEAYVENVFPRMNIGWETYMSFTCHKKNGGCFRCHNEEFKTDGGETITTDCNACHIILAEEEKARDMTEILKSAVRQASESALPSRRGEE